MTYLDRVCPDCGHPDPDQCCPCVDQLGPDGFGLEAMPIGTGDGALLALEEAIRP